MIGMARFQEKKHDDSMRISGYYQRDYIAMSLIVNFLLTTIAYVLLLAFIALFNLEDILSSLNEVSFRPIVAGLIVIYLVFLGVFSVISFTRAKIRYVRAQADMEQYKDALERLNRMYREEDRLKRREQEEEYDDDFDDFFDDYDD